MTDPVFLDLDDVLVIHEEQLARYGGAAGIRDAKLLESAVVTPRATFGGDFVHNDLFAMPPHMRSTSRRTSPSWMATSAPVFSLRSSSSR